MATDPMEAPEWFKADFVKACMESERGSAIGGPNYLWRAMVERGWESVRLVGGGRQPDGTLARVQKVPTLVVPSG